MMYLPLILPVLAGAIALNLERVDRRLKNGLARTPPMGWNSYNHYNCAPNESIIMSNAKALVDLGLSDLGYTYAGIDCGWTLPDRAADGTLPWNKTTFASGIPALGSYVHSLGLKFGIYSDGGLMMCSGDPNQTGSLFHETTDAQTFAKWGVDLLKYDNCWSTAEKGYPFVDYEPESSPRSHFQTMSSALAATGRAILFQVCEWGVDFPSAWAPSIGNTWRVTNDIVPAWRTIYRIVNQVPSQVDFGGPGGWLDLDMLEIGNDIFTVAEEQTHFSLWAILKSPLTIGCALKDTITSIKAASLAVLKNEDAIGFNQDSLGVSASLTRRYTEEEYDIWSGPLSNGRIVVAVVNWRNATRDITFDFADTGVSSVGSIKDVWLGSSAKPEGGNYTRSVPAHGTMLLELASPTYMASRSGGTFIPATSFTPSGNASFLQCTPGLCEPVGTKITALDEKSFATYSAPATSGNASRYVELYYINNEIALATSWTNGTNSRNITVQINDGKSVRLDVPISGRSSELYSPMKGWGDVAVLGIDVAGWNVDGQGEDKIVVGNKDGQIGVQRFGADFVGIKVY